MRSNASTILYQEDTEWETFHIEKVLMVPYEY